MVILDSNTKLTVLHNASGVFTDYTRDCFDFSRDTATITIATSTGYLYIGFSKPFNSVYIDLTTPNTNAATLSMDYWNGTSYSSLAGAYDDTKGFTRSGFITWNRNQTNQVANSVNSTSLYWIRLTPSATTSATVFTGISFLFADDQDLKTEVPEIADSNHLAGKTSHILTHMAVRNQIIQDLRNKDYTTTNETTGLKQDLTVWDILDANQLKQSAIYLALSKIYFNFSDAPEDVYSIKSAKYYSKYEKALALARISIDSDNDGESDDFETLKEFKNIRITR